MGARVSSLTRRFASRTPSASSQYTSPSNAPSYTPHSSSNNLPPRAVADDFLKWQQLQRDRVQQEKWHTQRMLEEQRRELHAKNTPPPTQTSVMENTGDVNTPISLEEARVTSREDPNTIVRGGNYTDEMDDVEFQQALKKLSSSMPLHSQVPESVEFSREATVYRKQTNESGLLHWENWTEILQLHNYNPEKWTAERLAAEFKVDPIDLGHALQYTMLPFLSYSKKQVTAHWQTEISTAPEPAPKQLKLH